MGKLTKRKNDFLAALKSEQFKNTFWRGFRYRFSFDLGGVLGPFSERILKIVRCCTFTLRVFKNTAHFQRIPLGTHVFALPTDSYNFQDLLKKKCEKMSNARSDPGTGSETRFAEAFGSILGPCWLHDGFFFHQNRFSSSLGALLKRNGPKTSATRDK